MPKDGGFTEREREIDILDVIEVAEQQQDAVGLLSDTS
jgi:hypothetical protein